MYDKSNHEHVSAFKCSVCIKFEDKLHSLRNFDLADARHDLETAEHQEERDEDDITMLHTRKCTHGSTHAKTKLLCLYTAAALSREELAIFVTKVFEGGGYHPAFITGSTNLHTH